MHISSKLVKGRAYAGPVGELGGRTFADFVRAGGIEDFPVRDDSPWIVRSAFHGLFENPF